MLSFWIITYDLSRKIPGGSGVCIEGFAIWEVKEQD